MPTTPNMSLLLPIPTITLGPLWARQLNAALSLVDLHDHSPGKGVKITPAGLNINNDLIFLSHNATNLRTTRFDNQTAALALVDDIRCVYVINGDLWYNNGAGVPVQLTVGNSINSATVSTITRAFEVVIINANRIILPSDTFSYLEVLTSSGAFTITLPAANSVASGRLYEIKDIAGNADTQNISIAPAGTDTIDGVNTTFIIKHVFGTQRFVSDGISKWFLQNYFQSDDTVTTSTIPVYSGPSGKIIKKTNVVIDSGDNMIGANSFQYQGPVGVYTQPKAASDKSINIIDGSSNVGRPIVTSATPATEGLMIVRGQFNSAGTFLNGEGFSVVRNSLGVYTVTFSAAFTDAPIVVASPTLNNVIIVTPGTFTTTSFIIHCFSTSAAAIDCQVTFIAIGQRGA